MIEFHLGVVKNGVLLTLFDSPGFGEDKPMRGYLYIFLVSIFFSSMLLADEIDFEGLPPGTIVDELSKGSGISGNLNGVVKVQGRNTIFPGTNAAIIFDSTCTPTALSYCEVWDVDLGTPNEDFGGPGIGDGGEFGSPYQNDTPYGNILVLAKDLVDSNADTLVDDPDDADVPGFVDFDFSMVKKNSSDSTVTIDSVTLMDIEFDEGESPALIELMGPGLPTATIAVVDTGNNGVVTIGPIGLSGVDKMRINFKGSGGMVGATFDEPRGNQTCWITTGGFQNGGIQSGGKDYTFGGNVGPPPSGSWEVVDHNTGDNFHSNNVAITDCIEIDGTGPQQPGGKKGFVINQAFFEGTGRLNHVDGYPFTGYVIDRGEPSGKNGNDTDEFCLTARDPGTLEVVFDACGMLDGGNVQIHPPSGKSN